MSNATQSPKQPDQSVLASAMEESLRRPASRHTLPVTAEVKPTISKPPRNSSVLKQKVEMEIHTGDSTSTLTCDFPTELKGLLKIESMRRQMAKIDGPKSLQDIVVTACREWYAKNVAA